MLCKAGLIKKKVSKYFNLTPLELTSKRRHQSIVRARFACVHLLKVFTDLSHPEIGRHLKKDQSTISNAERRARELLETDIDFLKDVTDLKLVIKTEIDNGIGVVFANDNFLIEPLSVLDLKTSGHKETHMVLSQDVGDRARVIEHYAQELCRSLVLVRSRLPADGRNNLDRLTAMVGCVENKRLQDER